MILRITGLRRVVPKAMPEIRRPWACPACAGLPDCSFSGDNVRVNAPRFYCPPPLQAGLCCELPPGAARHAARVLRLRSGDMLTLFDGRGGDFAARVSSVERERVFAELLDWRDHECEAPLSITLVQALQAGEKMDLTVQKAVELGVAQIQPVMARRSVVRLEGERAARRVGHWQGVAVAACEQCGRNRVPQVADITPLADWLAHARQETALRLLLLPGAAHSLATLPPPASGTRVELLIGAEGGLAPEEIELALRAGFVAIRLGPRILRTETAGLAALAAMQCLWGDFREAGSHV